MVVSETKAEIVSSTFFKRVGSTLRLWLGCRVGFKTACQILGKEKVIDEMLL
jgi:hypothetical protein